MLHGVEDKIDAMKGGTSFSHFVFPFSFLSSPRSFICLFFVTDINMLKMITDELSPPEIKKAITNLSREMAKLRAVVKESSGFLSFISFHFLFYFILFYFILFYFILFYFIIYVTLLLFLFPIFFFVTPLDLYLFY